MKEQMLPTDIQLTKEINTELYHDPYKVLSHNCFLNVIMGGRGMGKTTQWILHCIKSFIKNGDEFIYLRRYRSESALVKQEFMDEYFEGSTFVGLKNNCGYWKVGETVLGYSISLSMGQNFKSMQFPKVKYIIYDEGIIKKSATQRYLKDEVTLLFEFMSTVFRHRTNGRVIILGNNLDFFNPYCEYFNVKVFNKKFVDNERGLYIAYDDTSPALRKIEEETPLYKLSKGTTYHEYHYNNAVLRSKSFEISEKRPTDRICLRLVINKYTMNFYIRDNYNWLIETKQKVIMDSMTYPLMEKDEINYHYVKRFKEKYVNFLYNIYGNQLIEFCDEDSQALFTMLLDLMK